MSLAEQSQQWYPTNVNVTVLQAHSLKAKGKNGTNDAYAIIQLGKEKFSTSVSEKSLAPVWREEASFELPLFHQGNQERCTLRIVVMHRALVGLDQFLGEAVINLLELHENKERNKTEWFKLKSKAGKKEKERGEVHVNIQFMRNNMTASMFDLSMKDKSRSPFGKLKDKIRGKKDRGGFSDSASAIVPPVSQVLTDSEGEEGGGGKEEKPKKSAKSKIKSIFGKSSNLQRSSLSQSMSVLPSLQPLPERNAWLSGSRSSGLDVEPSLSPVPEVEKSESTKVSTLLSMVRGRKDSLKNSDSVSPPETPVDKMTKSVPKKQGSQEFEAVPLRRKPVIPSKEEQDPDPYLQEKERGAKNPSAPTTGFPSWAASKVTAVKPSNPLLSLSQFTDPTDVAPYSQLTHDELVALVGKQKEALSKKDCQIRDLEDYIDNLLVRVMEETPNILRNLPSKQAGRI
ncbi:RFIP2 protein, partial [Polyodon spathula]|nr:RFIP2 protein [Polyodon spathula]